jgi:hypothetical protein
MRLEPSYFVPAVLFGPKKGQLIRLDGHEFIRIKDGRYYPTRLLESKVHLFDGVKVMTGHPEFAQPSYNRPLRIGRVLQPKWYARTREIRGILELTSPPYQRVVEAGGRLGLSPLFYEVPDGPLITDIIKILSVDVVEEPYSGGRVLPITEALAKRNWQERVRCAFDNGDIQMINELARAV